MRVIIIGVNGFIGSSIFKYLSHLGVYDCWGADIFMNKREERFFLLESGSIDFESIFSDIKFDYCINCSGAANVSESNTKTLNDFELNTFNVAKILESIKKHNSSCAFINLSSAAVYGNPVLMPVSENEACNPISPYGFHKMMAESLCKEYYNIFGIKTLNIRIFSAYGPGLRKQLFWDLYQKFLLNSDIVLSGTGHETRDFIHIKDIVRAIEILLHKGDYSATVYNLASNSSYTIQYVSEYFLKLLGFNRQILFDGVNKQGYPLFWVADITKINNIGFQPRIGIEDGLKSYAEWIERLK